ncbi:DNA polymerase III subunit beta [Clostridium cochlearium]|uniref:DNA polymerase III subunit beta n=1 Tax=Clostridium cochlearium TaxID=1494 RepID=UPI0014599678|nr:DNA polymerase III subunit beta [Clostridium cochlearium]MBV1818778.1 DNA polymerase III subunit beta [Bacteroidales bacterium MSK.15.36]NSJ90543.1 DNA polymerase III subunit beta [Coprococcus sp. MSK.21.13]MCG4571966.1 DNA polymerase III subunit beta [Clostridium cochlearium]MCG4579710.1 DNA polymerase III subunit beta [Clostridium cochlearium]NME95197.1 DNA polymerase III subunit beta [Clostridium cochlearium]
MKLFCNKSILQESISIAQKAVTGKSTMPILQGIFIKAENNSLILTGSDIDLSIETVMEAEVIEEGSIVIDSKIFGDIIRKLPNDVIEITSKDNNIIEIKCQKSKFNLIHMNADEFPELPKINENIIFSIPEGLLKNMIRGTIFATSQEETRPILTGLLFEIKNKVLNLVALDGYRLAVKSEMIDSENSISAVIPGKTLNEVSKILSENDEKVNITFTPNHILFSIGKTKIISRLLEGDFINYDSIIPKEYNLKVTAKRAKFLECIERASLMGKDGNTSLIKLNITDDSIIITSNSQLGMVREEMGIILQGENLEIAFNSKYLIDALKVMEEDEIILELSSSISPCVIKNKEANDCTYLVLPVRLASN